jgi:hypothetical protein
MARISAVVLADTETHGELARVLNALALVQEAAEAGDEVELVFDGAGTKWIPELAHSDHKLHELFESVRPHIAGACAFCVNAFEVNEGVRQADVPLLDEYHGHPSLRQRVADGYEVVTF